MACVIKLSSTGSLSIKINLNSLATENTEYCIVCFLVYHILYFKTLFFTFF